MRTSLWWVTATSALTYGCVAPLTPDEPAATAEGAATADAKVRPTPGNDRGPRSASHTTVTVGTLASTHGPAHGNAVKVHIELQKAWREALVPTNAIPVDWMQVTTVAFDGGGVFDPSTLQLAKMGTVGRVTRADKPAPLYALWGTNVLDPDMWKVGLIIGSDLFPLAAPRSRDARGQVSASRHARRSVMAAYSGM